MIRRPPGPTRTDTLLPDTTLCRSARYDQAAARFDAEVVAGNARAFVAEKLAERDERHKRMGDSRYVVEPNVKEGKGGLRDLHTLFWIGKFIHRVRTVPELVDAGQIGREHV